MKVYCRFAPPHALVSTTDVDCNESTLQTSSWVAPTMVLLSLCKSDNDEQQVFTVTDPLSGSIASSTCQRVFIPSCMTASALGAASLNSSSGQQEKQPEQQKRVFDEVARPFLQDLISGRRCTFLAYGQTTTGKTYTMFGPGVDDNDSKPQRGQQLAPNKRAELLSREETCEEEDDAGEEEGIVPRFLRAIFDVSCAGLYGRSVTFVDLSCLEVYNECTTDLVALQLRQQEHQEQIRMPTSKKRNVKSSAVLDDFEGDGLRRACLRYGSDGLCSSSMRKVSYKSTEKSQVLRAAMCLRCTSAVECWRLLCGVLTLRHRSETERNVRSSRSHLLLRLVLHTADVTPGRVVQLGEAMFVDLAGSETYREYAWTGAGGGSSNHYNLNSTGSNTTVVSGHTGTLASPFLLTSTADIPLVASTFTATRRDGDGLTAAERNSIRTTEMRHINSSLLAIRNVVRALRTTALTTRVPFRDSTLTTIMEPFLVPGGSATVAWIVCCSSRQCDFHETVESLRLGADASAIPAHVQLVPAVFPTNAASRNTLSNNIAITGGSAVEFGKEKILSSKGVYTQPVVSSSSASAAVAINTIDIESITEKRRGNTVTGAVIQRGGRNGSINSSKLLLANANNYPNSPSKADKSSVRTSEYKEDVEVYKQYAWHLLDQCKTLCERYDECVEEFAGAKQVIASQRREIAELKKALSAAEGKKDPPQRQEPKPQKNKKEKELVEELQREANSVGLGEHTIPAPPAWLQKSVIHWNHNEISLALRHLSLTGGSAGERKAEEEKEVQPVSKNGLEHRDAETSEPHDDDDANDAGEDNIGSDDCSRDVVTPIDTTLHSYCVHHGSLQYRHCASSSSSSSSSNNKNKNNRKGDTSTRIEPSPVVALESKGLDDAPLFTTRAEAVLGTGMPDDDVFPSVKTHVRRERLVSFLSPSSQAAMSLMELEEERCPPHVIPPPIGRSSPHTNAIPSVGEALQDQRPKRRQTQKEEVTKTKGNDTPGEGESLLADENAAAGILQHLISRSAAFVGTVTE